MTKDDLVHKIRFTTKCKSIWRFPVFTQAFCDEFLEELFHFQQSDLPKGRPNTMNHYGVQYFRLYVDQYTRDKMHFLC